MTQRAQAPEQQVLIMELLKRRAYARAGLLGNPSDGFHGKTLSLIVRDYFAEVVLYSWEDVELVLSQEDKSRFGSIRELADDVRLHGYYGGIRLVKATVKKFVDYCDRMGHALHDRNFSLRYETNIPRQVGLAGSSAIIVATLRCLMDFYDIAIPEKIQPSLALSVEVEELGIAGGLQDRVIQVYEGLVYMDFSESVTQVQAGFEYGRYERLPTHLLPPLYIAYSTEASEPTEFTHGPLRARYEDGIPRVVNAMQTFAEIAAEGRDALLRGDTQRLSELIDVNFDTRQNICDLSRSHVDMIQAARAAGASAKYCGSGGAIIGTYSDEAMFDRLRASLRNCRVFKPTVDIAAPTDDSAAA